MPDLKTLLERADRAVSRVPLPADGLDRLQRRRDRRRRNQRLAAGVVGMAVFVAAIWLVTTGGPVDRTQTPAVPGTATGPTATGPTATPTVAPTAWDGLSLPPKGAVPSTPEEGKVVASSSAMHVGWVFVYADGRVISWPDRGPINEQRLSPEGVDLVRSGAVKPREFLPRHDLGLVPQPPPLPARGWADPEIRPYVPPSYAVCGPEPAEFLTLLPKAAADLLRGKERAFDNIGMRATNKRAECFDVTTDEARALEEILREEASAVLEQNPDASYDSWLGYRLEPPNGIGDPLLIQFNPILPHGTYVLGLLG